MEMHYVLTIRHVGSKKHTLSNIQGKKPVINLQMEFTHEVIVMLKEPKKVEREREREVIEAKGTPLVALEKRYQTST